MTGGPQFTDRSAVGGGPAPEGGQRDPSAALANLARLAPPTFVRCMHTLGNPTDFPPALTELLPDNVLPIPLDTLTQTLVAPDGSARLHSAWLAASTGTNRSGFAHVASAGPLVSTTGITVESPYLVVTIYDLTGVEGFDVLVATMEPTVDPNRADTPRTAFRLHLDHWGNIVDCTDEVLEILGRQPSDFIGQAARSIMHTDDLDAALTAWRQALTSPEMPRPGRVRIQHVDGSWRWFEYVNWNALADPTVRAVVTELLDVDEQVRVEQLGVASSRAHERLVRVLDEVDDIVLMGRADTGLVYWNRTAERHLDDLRTGVPIADLMNPAMRELSESVIRPMIERLERWQGDIDVTFRDGTVHTMAGTVTPVLDGADDIYFGVILRDVTAERSHAQELRQLARLDPLTSLPNRLGLVELLQASEARDMTVCFLDLDHLKVVNDGLGHGAGDKLLIATADALRSVAGHGTVTRFGGDEFVVIHPDLGGVDQAVVFAETLLESVRGIQVPEISRRVSASLGVVWTQIEDLDPEKLITDADTAMYDAKRRGRGRVSRFDFGQRESITRRFVMETALQSAIANDEIDVHLQPVVQVPDRRIIGFEALARWGVVSPAEFVPTAEESGLIIPLGKRVMDLSLQHLARVDQHLASADRSGDLSTPPPRVAVNVSGRELLEPDFAARTLETLSEHGFDPERLALEITESVLIDTSDEVEGSLRLLRDAGVSLVLDDFGTGYSSIAYLRRYPVDGLKLDNSYTRALLSQTDTRVIAETIISLAHRLGMSIVAEGVEDEAELAVLVDLGVSLVQGYLLSHPLPIDDLLLGPLGDHSTSLDQA